MENCQPCSSAVSLQPDSPCIGACSTTYGDDICKGCGRTFLEVINWIVFDDRQKAVVWARLAGTGSEVVV